MKTTRRKHLTACAWLLLAAALAATFARNFSDMWIRWFPSWGHVNSSLYQRIAEGESYYTHGPLVPLVSLFIALLLIRHTKVPAAPRPVSGGIVLGASLLLHLAGCLARVNFVSGFAFIGTLCGLVLMLWGGAALRRLWFPLAFLFFMVPLPEVSIAQLNFRLKMLSADWGVRLANLGGIMAERAGNRVFLAGDKSLVIANVCNGLRTLISVIAVCAIYAYVCRLKGLWRLALFGMSVPVALLANALRIVGLIVVADVWDTPAATGWFHDTSGVAILVMAFVMMLGLEHLILWLHGLVGRPVAPAPRFADVRRGPEDQLQWSGLAAAGGTWVGGLACGAVALTALTAAWLNQRTPPLRTGWDLDNAAPLTVRIDGRQWVGRRIELDEQTLTILERPEYIYRQYDAPGAEPVQYCVIWSRDNRKAVHPPDLCLEGGADIVDKSDVDLPRAGDAPLPCRELLVQTAPNQTIYFLYTYKCGRSYTRSFWRQQFHLLVNKLLGRNSGGALIRVSLRLGDDRAEARATATQMMGALAPYVEQVLP